MQHRQEWDYFVSLCIRRLLEHLLNLWLTVSTENWHLHNRSSGLTLCPKVNWMAEASIVSQDQLDVRGLRCTLRLTGWQRLPLYLKARMLEISIVLQGQWMAEVYCLNDKAGPLPFSITEMNQFRQSPARTGSFHPLYCGRWQMTFWSFEKGRNWVGCLPESKWDAWHRGCRVLGGHGVFPVHRLHLAIGNIGVILSTPAGVATGSPEFSSADILTQTEAAGVPLPPSRWCRRETAISSQALPA